MIEKTIVYSEQDIEKIAQQLVDLLQQCKVMTFSGPLGAGKTTMIRMLLRLCGIAQPITSPTFTYLNQYENERSQTFYHFDLYRLANLDEFLQAGFDEYLHQPDSWTLIEWPEIVMPLLTHDVCHANIDYHEKDDTRMLIIKCI